MDLELEMWRNEVARSVPLESPVRSSGDLASDYNSQNGGSSVPVEQEPEPEPTAHPIPPEAAHAATIQLGGSARRKECVLPRSEYRAWLQKLKSLALLGWRYRRSSVVPNVSALQRLHVDAMDLLLGIGPPVSRIRQELEHLKLALYGCHRIDWRESCVYTDKIRRFTKLLIAAHRIVEREHRATDPGAVRSGAERATSEGAPLTESAVAAKRRSVVMPILKLKRWTRGKWATKSGVGKNCVYEYLDGKRNPGDKNRKAMAEELGLEPTDLPE